MGRGHLSKSHAPWKRGTMYPFSGSSSVQMVVLLLTALVARRTEGALDHDALELVWYDEFVGDQVDWDKWLVDEGDGCDIGLCDWGNSEQQYYRTENAHVANGELGITAKQEDFSSRFYTSSKLTTKNRFVFRYGRVEARIKLPPGGQGLWPAFWMMPQDNIYGKWAASGEIDILESRNNLTEVTHNLNFGDAYPNNTNYNGECTLDYPEGTLQDYHVYALEWDDEEIIWFVDEDETCRHESWFATDVKTGTYMPKPAPFDQDFYLVLNVAVGGNEDYVGDDPVDDSALPAEMVVDWIRVYQTPEQYGAGPTSPYIQGATGGGSRQGVMVWGDDFSNGTAISPDWDIVHGQACIIGTQRLCSSEIQVFHSAEVESGEGVLSVSAKTRSTYGGDSDSGWVETAKSGFTRSLGSFNFTYGRVEATLARPMVTGVVSTISLIPITAENGTDSGQVDVLTAEQEMIIGGLWYLLDDGTDSPVASNITCVAPPSINDNTEGSYNSSSFETFAVEWTEDRIRWYSGGIQYCEVTEMEVEDAGGIWPFHEAMYVAIAVAVGRDVFGEPLAVDSSLLPATLEVDSVGVYRFADMDGTAVQASATNYTTEANLTWHDEFDGVELDSASATEAGEGVRGLDYWWQHEEGNGCEEGICGFGNGEAQWYTKDNTAVVDGNLVITIKAESYGDNIYTSAKLSTNATVMLQYGRIEARVKLPSAQGLWPSIWLLPHDSPYGGWASSGAIDLLQSRNYMDRVHGQLIFGGAYPDVDNLDLYQGGHCYSDMYDDFSGDYHVFALEWEEDAFRWYVDDILYCNRDYWYSRPGPGYDDYPFPAPFNTSFYMIFNVAVGGSFTGGLIDEAALEEEPQMLVDYVRIYQFEGQNLTVADRPEETSSGASSLNVQAALAVLAGLGAMIILCLVASCVSKCKKKRDEAEYMGHNSSTFNSNITDSSATKDSAPSKAHLVSMPVAASKYHTKGIATPNGIMAAAANGMLKSNTNTLGYKSKGMSPSGVSLWIRPEDGDVAHETISLNGSDSDPSADPAQQEYRAEADTSGGEISTHSPMHGTGNKQPRPPSGTVPAGWLEDGSGSENEDDEIVASLSSMSSSPAPSPPAVSRRASSSAWGSGAVPTGVAGHSSPQSLFNGSGSVGSVLPERRHSGGIASGVRGVDMTISDGCASSSSAPGGRYYVGENYGSGMGVDSHDGGDAKTLGNDGYDLDNDVTVRYNEREDGRHSPPTLSAMRIDIEAGGPTSLDDDIFMAPPSYEDVTDSVH